MKKAILYTRVSTDEQADKGYSLQNQLERLLNYCEIQNVSVVTHFQEDYSAKTFDRPEFNKLIQYCKGNEQEIDLLLFLNWSRFSRNAADSYSTISRFQKMGIEVQAIEQPLDLTIPENKMMLAFYLAAPEVENDRRSLNTKMGMHRARKEGRYLGVAPVGYKNIRDEQGRGKIVPNPTYAPIIEKLFEEFSSGIYNTEEMRKRMYSRGLKMSRGAFPTLLRNPIYSGYIFIPKYKDDPAHFVKGQHEAIISEEVFKKVQDVLNGKTYKRKTNNTLKEELPLRGFLQCRVCGGALTGSASKGNGGKYFYYHCQKGCNERFKAVKANSEFERFLTQLKARPEIIDLYHVILKDVFKNSQKENEKERKKIDEEITRNKTRINNAQLRMLDGDLTVKEYKEIKSHLETLNDGLMRQKISLPTSEAKFNEYLSFSCSLLKNIDSAYKRANLEIKQRIIGSIFPGKLIFEENKYRTTKVNEVVSLMCLNNSELEGNEKGHKKNNFQMSCQVAPTGIAGSLFWA